MFLLFIVLLSSSSVTLRVKLDMVFFPLLHNYVMFCHRLHFFFFFFNLGFIFWICFVVIVWVFYVAFFLLFFLSH